MHLEHIYQSKHTVCIIGYLYVNPIFLNFGLMLNNADYQYIIFLIIYLQEQFLLANDISQHLLFVT